MPGLVNMNTSANGGPVARDGDSKKRTHDGKMVNGEHAIARKDAPAGAPAVKTPSYKAASANGLSTSGAPVPTADKMAQLPPEITRIGPENYHPLSTLIQRVSQETYNDLSEVLMQMREMKPSQANGNMSNGLGLPNPQDQEINKQKKLLLLRFAMDNRAKFIKLLVLTDWGKRASKDVSQLIDLFAWTNQQSWAQNQIDDKIEQIKLAMNQARQLNPDIRTALEILGTGKAEWIPDVSYTGSGKVRF